jgi:hypothetical protein
MRRECCISAPEIARFPEVYCDGPGPVEACERSPIAPPLFLPAPGVSSPSLPLRLPCGQCLQVAHMFDNLDDLDRWESAFERRSVGRTKIVKGALKALFNNRRCTFASVVILPRNVLASVVRHERRRHKAYYRASGDVDGNRIAGVIGGE